MNAVEYRPDVDGLRAIAVALVLLFHADLGFEGGFVGVDVFFVISGFLITRLIRKQQQCDSFQLSHFWARRIRRIVPASTFVAVVSLIFGTMLLLPEDLENLAKSIVAQQLISSNIFFLRQSGYFDDPSNLKPLLHTWSLAVEEQFYLFYPLILVFAQRLSNRMLCAILVTLAITSLAVSEWSLQEYPSATFFLLHTRAWEMLLGGILVFIPRKRVPRAHLANALSWCGLFLILMAGWCYDATSRFPGVGALPPCIGAALFIFSNTNSSTHAGRIIASKPLVAMGLMSYSLYLWHWPVLAFSRYWLGPALPVSVRVSSLFAISCLAYASWRHIETPFRTGTSERPVHAPYIAATLCCSVVLAISTGVILTGGLRFRFSDNVLQYAETRAWPVDLSRNELEVARGDLPVLGDNNLPNSRIDFMVWGDSHARFTAKLFDNIANRNGLRGVIAARGGYVPLLDVWRPARNENLVDWNAAVLEFIRTRHVKNVFLVSRWAFNIEGRADGRTDFLIADSTSHEVSREEARQVMRRGLKRTLRQLRNLEVKVWIMKQVPLQSGDPRKSLCLAEIFGETVPVGVSWEAHSSRQANVHELFASLPTEDVTLLDPAPFCFDDSGNSRIGDRDGSYYKDDDHLTDYGAETLLSDLLSPVFTELSGNYKQPVKQWSARAHAGLLELR